MPARVLWAMGLSLAVHVGALALLSSARPVPLPKRVDVGPSKNWVAVGLLSKPGGAARPTAEVPAPPKRLLEAKPGPGIPVAPAIAPAVEASVGVESSGGAEGRPIVGAGSNEPSFATGEGEGSVGPASFENSALDVAGLHARLQEAAARCYPPEARRFRQTGTAQLRFCVGEGGTMLDPSVVQSSGHKSLDDAVLSCVVPRTASLSPAAAGECFEAPIHFGAK